MPSCLIIKTQVVGQLSSQTLLSNHVQPVFSLMQAQWTEERNSLNAESIGGLLFQQYDFVYGFPHLPEEQCKTTKQNVVE